MNEYQLKIFEEIRSNQNVFLLNGSSVSELESKIHKLKDRKIIYWGFNNIAGIEKNILSKIKHYIDVYFTMDLSRVNLDYINEFLERKENNLVIISYTLLENQFFRNSPIVRKNIHKICVYEDVISRIPYTLPPNSVSVAMYMFCVLNYFNTKYKPLIFFGFDGIGEKFDTDNPPYSYKETYKTENFQLHDLSESVKTFDQYFFPELKNSITKMFENGFQILNANKESYYSSLPKISQEEAIQILIENSSKKKAIRIHKEPSCEKKEQCYKELLSTCEAYLWRRDYNGHIKYVIDTISQIKVEMSTLHECCKTKTNL